MLRDPISAVTVCVGYGDFLRASAPWNRHQFDKWVVVTSQDDKETRDVCRLNRITCLVTDDHTRDGSFSKGRAIERGLQHLPLDSWVLHVDADVVLPLSFRHELSRAHLKPETIYGADRIMLHSWDQWQKFQLTGWLQQTNAGALHSLAPPRGYQIGARWIGPDGHVPIGFFQLWHRKGGEEEVAGARVKPYPSGHGSACREDVQHGLQWDRRQRELLAELFVVHLESEQCKTGANWKGRTTKRFGPEKCPPPKPPVS